MVSIQIRTLLTDFRLVRGLGSSPAGKKAEIRGVSGLDPSGHCFDVVGSSEVGVAALTSLVSGSFLVSSPSRRRRLRVVRFFLLPGPQMKSESDSKMSRGSCRSTATNCLSASVRLPPTILLSNSISPPPPPVIVGSRKSIVWRGKAKRVTLVGEE